MYLSRLSFCTLPGKTHEAAQSLNTLIGLIADGSANRPRVLRASLVSPGGCDLQVEQEVDSLAALESDIQRVAGKPEFQSWSRSFSPLLQGSPKREILEIVAS